MIAQPPQRAVLAGALLSRAIAAFAVVPAEARGPSLGAIDGFLAAPRPATFLAAARVLTQARRAHLFARSAGSSIERAFADGIAALRAFSGLPEGVVDRLAADLPVDPRAGQRLLALTSLLRSYDELLGRVLADTEEMRRKLRASAGRRPGTRR